MLVDEIYEICNMFLTIKLLLSCFALAIAFKNAKAYDDAIASYMKQADVQKQTGSYPFCCLNIIFVIVIYMHIYVKKKNSAK